MYIFSQRIKEALDKIDGSITPLEPPYVNVLHGVHTTKQKLGRILSKVIPDTTTVKEYVEEYKEINGQLGHYQVEYTTEFVEIYSHALYAIDSTTKSCMTDSASVRVYGYDERLSLLVVYKESKLVMRTLVRSDKMEYVRLYIDHNFIKTHIAKAIVAKEGYKKGSLEGIKLQYIEENGCIFCPYLDRESQFDIIDDAYLIIRSGGAYDGNTTSGYVEREDVCTCNCCGDRVPVEDSFYVDDENICEYCYDRNYIIYNGESYYKDNCIVNKSNGELIPEACIDYEDISCTDAGEWYNSDEVICISDCYYHESECIKLVREDEDGNEYALNEDAIYNPEELDMLASGYWVKGQIQDVLDELNETLNSLQTDLFEDKDVVELTTEEIDTLVIEIGKIELLIG